MSKQKNAHNKTHLVDLEKNNTRNNSDQIKDHAMPAKFLKLLKKTKTSKKSLSRQNTDSYNNINNIYSNAIIDFFEKATHQEISSYLHQFLLKSNSCNKQIGVGAMGNITQSGVGNTYKTYYPNNITIDIPVVVKSSNVDSVMNIDIISNNIFISNNRNISTETLILYFIKPLIILRLSPHLPLILDHAKCYPEQSQSVDHIILERHGLSDIIKIDIPGLYDEPLWKHRDDVDPIKPTFNTRIATLGELIKFIHLTKDTNDNITLPNGIPCNSIELIDYLSISYLVSHDLLSSHGIYLSDMHMENILIHWLNKDSYLNDEYIGETQFIYYKFGSKMYKIKTFGILLKIGDVGGGIVQPRKDVYIVGQGINLSKTHQIVIDITNTQTNYQFFMYLNINISFDMLRKTIGYKIISMSPYNKIVLFMTDRELLKKILSLSELLKLFDKYSVNQIDEKKNYLIFGS